MTTLLPCPLCGGISGYAIHQGTTYRWWYLCCKDCGDEVGECGSDRDTGCKVPEGRNVIADAYWNAVGAHAQGLRDEIAQLKAELEARKA